MHKQIVNACCESPTDCDFLSLNETHHEDHITKISHAKKYGTHDDMTTAATIPRIAVGDSIPNVGIKIMGADGNVADVRVSDLFAKKRGILFAVPGAFTPTCSLKHLPGFIDKHAQIRARHGFDVIACIAVNDAFVMHAWGQQQGCDKAGIVMLADGNGDFTGSIGMLRDSAQAGMGHRSFRYALVIEDNVVKYVGVDAARGALDESGADKFLGEFMPSSL